MSVLRKKSTLFFCLYEQKKGGICLLALRKRKQGSNKKGGNSRFYNLRDYIRRYICGMGNHENDKQSARNSVGCAAADNFFNHLAEIRNV